MGKKLGMTQVFDGEGRASGATVVEAGPCQVTQVRNFNRDGYTAVQLGFDPTVSRRLTGAERGHLGDLPSYRVLREFRTESAPEISVGDQVTVDSFSPGDIVDVSGISKGKGFAGVVKRHGFRGGPRTHGQSDRLRAPGSVGAGTSPSRVFKGVRMAGRLGGKRVTVRNARILEVHVDKNLLVVGGAVPGSRNQVLEIRLVQQKAAT